MSFSLATTAAKRALDLSELEPGPNPQVFKGVHFPSDPFVPDSVAAGQELTVSGRVHLDCITCFNVPARVRIESAGSFDAVNQEVGDLDHCQNRTFNISVPVPDDPGGTVAVTLKAQRQRRGQWRTQDTFGPVRVSVVTQGQKSANTAVAALPWAAGGAAAGAALSTVTGSDLAQSALVGSGVGGAVGLGVQQPAFRNVFEGLIGAGGDLATTGAFTATGAGLGAAAGELAFNQPAAGAVAGGAVGLGASQLTGQNFPLLEIAALTALLGAGGFALNNVLDLAQFG